MIYTNMLMLMIAQFLFGGAGAEEFSQEFPATLSAAFDALHAENARLCDLLEEQMPELCAAFDPYETGDPDTLTEARFREKVLEVYQEALPLSLQAS